MKISNIVCEAATIPYEWDFYPTWYPGQTEKEQTIFIVRVQTDEGIEGCATCEAPFGILAIMKETVEYLKTFLVGESPFDVERLILRFRNVARIAARPWLVENALWDIVGKASNLPVYKIFGAARDRIRVYAAWGEIRSIEQRKEDAQQLVSEGFKAVKLRFHHEKMKDDLAIVEAVRDAVGDKLEIMADANQGTAVERATGGVPPVWSYERARNMAKEMEKLHCAWLEEPLFRYDYDGLARLSREVELPIAGGEINKGIHEFKQMLDKGSYDILQPNCTMSEGMSQIRKIAAIADAYGKLCNPHAWIPGLGVMQTMHVAASIPNFTWLEYPYDPPKITPDVFQGIVERYYVPEEDGCIPMPNAPGLGIGLDEEKIGRYRIKI
ncbi:MAG: mandelate racemase/muconate lactonizing enzyme family protein [Synergistaceae bacterium]|jgi:L-alanine-DL-glutamate epimerase-like enolase superfamily enzyme|nr:mandelate racemase/muconate lactonizing enzyme family protein [Synergistaceae bacterium]